MKLFFCLSLIFISSLQSILAKSADLISELTASPPALLERFGSAVAVGQQYFVISAPQDREIASSAGALYVYDRSTSTLVRKLLPSDSADSLLARAQTGISVAISGDLVVAGAPNWNSKKGVVFVWNATTGALINTITHPAATNNDEFGISVSISGNDILIGAWGDENLDASSDLGNHGTVFHYELDGTTSRFVRKYEAPSLVGEDRYGQKVLLTDSHVVVAVTNESQSSILQKSGTVYVYNKADGSLVHTLRASNAQQEGFFGGALSSLGNLLFVGNQNAAERLGHCYLFDLNTGNELLRIEQPSTEAQRFGQSVAIGDYLYISAYSEEQGYVYAYSTSGEYLTKFTSDDTFGGNQVGFSLDAYQGSVITGAPNRKVDEIASSGAAYLFGLHDFQIQLASSESSDIISWSSITNRRYRIQSSTNLLNWLDTASSPYTANSTNSSIMLPKTSAEKVFYRVSEE